MHRYVETYPAHGLGNPTVKNLNKVITVAASFGIMLCLGSVYAWSSFVPNLQQDYGFSSLQTQIIFGLIIAVFPTTMILAERILMKWGPRVTCILSAIFFGCGYMIAGQSNGNFIAILVGIGVLGGIGTGLGYLLALTSPVKCFPEKKGLVTGIAAAGFGLAAIILSYAVPALYASGKDTLKIFTLIGITYGIIIFALSFLIQFPTIPKKGADQLKLSKALSSTAFIRATAGIFCGTFAGLLVIGNLQPIGAISGIDAEKLKAGIAVFALSNFAGRLFWGVVGDLIGTRLSIVIALVFQAISILLIGQLELNGLLFITISAAIGFGFGANFVLFASETAHEFGVTTLGSIYPFVFLGYATAGIFGPMTGGFIYDTFETYSHAINIAGAMSFAGALLFLFKKKHS